ncbi:MAG TPA: DUF4330 family protein [Candidatus Enterenecus stercoripullorum]|nr:DUF4330 family protein [Candidatus Enterenecus stercoripullorum]
MEQSNPKFRLRLNLFDAIILVLALAAGAALIWFGLRSGGAAEAVPSARPVQYTIMIPRMAEGNSELIRPGDALEDTVENYRLGTVVSVTAQPAVVQVLNQETRRYVDAVLEGYEDVYITVESTCTESGSGDALLLDGGYDFRVGQTINVRGPGYLGSGRVTQIVREVAE